MLLFLEHFSVAACAISGALAARGRSVDLFGVLVLALVTAFGGGTVRDVCLGVTPFWIKTHGHVITALTAGLATFLLARRRDLPGALLELADAVGLALFVLIGTEKALDGCGAAPLAAVALGVITGVAGGVMRDVLLNEVPLVFRREIRLYATAAAAGAAVFVLLRQFAPGIASRWAVLTGSAVVLALRLAAVRWQLALPEFEDKRPS
ncbi:MAG: trimeric intracellular cation channel family protein [Verrucomicrobiales bacterium]|nr:trimeric intracellular cation channel family protein [Verrucomicrobiales bacterium]